MAIDPHLLIFQVWRPALLWNFVPPLARPLTGALCPLANPSCPLVKALENARTGIYVRGFETKLHDVRDLISTSYSRLPYLLGPATYP